MPIEKNTDVYSFLLKMQKLKSYFNIDNEKNL